MSGGIGRRLIPLVLILLVVGAALVVTRSALAEPAAITKAKSEAEALRDLIDELDAALEEANEDLNYARAKLKETVAAAERNQEKLTEAEADLEEAHARLSVRLVEIYKAGDLGMLDTLVGSASFSDVINRLALMERLSEQDARLIKEVKTFRQEVETRKAELNRQIAEERQLKADAEVAQDKLTARLADRETALKGKEIQIAQLEREEAARQAALAAAAKKAAEEAARKAREEAARKEREAAARTQAAATSTTVKRTTTTQAAATVTTVKRTTTTQAAATVTTVKPTTTTTTAASGSSGVTGDEVVAYALKFLGTPYVWGGYSTSGFDCSGFTKYVYAHFNIYLPHSSRMQYGYGVAVSRSNLKKGDLLFFYSPISHVAMYIGDGKMVHAAGTGKGVRIDYIWSSYVGARRLLH